MACIRLLLDSAALVYSKIRFEFKHLSSSTLLALSKYTSTGETDSLQKKGREEWRFANGEADYRVKSAPCLSYLSV